MAFDTSCWKLAKSFLEDGPRCLSADVNELAQAIQTVCEDHCRMIEDQERKAKEKFERTFAGLDEKHPADGLGEVFTMNEFNQSIKQ